jgi:hypothetical protein
MWQRTQHPGTARLPKLYRETGLRKFKITFKIQIKKKTALYPSSAFYWETTLNTLNCTGRNELSVKASYPLTCISPNKEYTV